MYDSSYQLVYMVVPTGKASNVVSYAKKLGATGGTITLARGTVKNKLLNFLSVFSSEKEMIMMGCKSELAKEILPKIVSKFKFEKSNRGIIFSTKVNRLAKSSDVKKFNTEIGECMHKLITVIVEKGKAETIVETANAAGARGGTIVNARGAGTAETMKLFNMEIEPQKEVLLIVVKNEKFQNVVNNILEKHEIQKPGSGILFVQDVHDAYGLTN